ncbi:hypothetical protein TWF481_008829 [Arthrobotrys musiformis]|uniref:Nephrocystin 3-like N-terminal domain-containing protein n=1 Tax=Arthrobotrys musiformis TaxID=47236 RepID=A0AAV9W8B6_9PEZI
MEAVGAAASIIAIVELAGKLTKLLNGYISDVKHADSDQIALRDRILAIDKLVKEVDQLIAGPYKDKLESSVELKDTLLKSKNLLKELLEKLEPKGARGRFRKYTGRLKWPFEKTEIEKTIANLKRFEETIQSALNLDQLKVVLKIDHNVNKIAAAVARISGLPVCAAAVFGSYEDQHEPKCLPNTREQLLKDFHAWVATSQNDTKQIFWLSGAAGTGKSTISRTIATDLRAQGMLAASFFFKRGGGDRGNASKFVTTIAAGLCAHLPQLSPYVENAVNQNPEISTKEIKMQFDSLVLEPLSSISVTPSPRSTASVIVIDALDECDDENNVRFLVGLLGKLVGAGPMDIRIFITSRPETPIRAGFRGIDGTYKDLVLHDIEQSIIKEDITTFLKQSFQDIVNECEMGLPAGWPGDDTIRTIVDISSPLFIVASTICRLVKDSPFGPKLQLQKILEYQSKSHISKLGRTYLPVFEQLLAGKDLDKDEEKVLIEDTMDTLGVIFVPKSRLSMRDLSQLLGTEEGLIRHRLSAFHSVLYIPEDPAEGIRPYHLSFQEFLLDPKTRGHTSFYIDIENLHGRLTEWCLSVLDKTLTRNICNLEPDYQRPRGVYRDTVVEKYVSPATEYACRWWLEHIIMSGYPTRDRGNETTGDHGKIHRFLEKHLLHWLELLALVDVVFMERTLPEQVVKFYRIISARDSPVLSELLYEIFQFLIDNLPLIKAHPLQIYTASILNAPEKSQIRQLFSNNISWLSRIPKPDRDWGSVGSGLPRLHGDWFRDCLDLQCIDFSYVGRYLLCISSSGTLWVFEIENLDEPPERFEVGSGTFIFAALFRQGGTGRIFVGTDDGEIKIIDEGSKKVIQTLKGDGNSKCSEAALNRTLRNSAISLEIPASSPQDSLIFASASNLKHSIKIWSIDIDDDSDSAFPPPKMIREIAAPSSLFTLISFSTYDDCTYLLAASPDVLFRIWDIETGDLVTVVQRDSGPAAALCPGLCCHENQITAMAGGRVVDEHDFRITKVTEAIAIGDRIELWDWNWDWDFEAGRAGVYLAKKAIDLRTTAGIKVLGLGRRLLTSLEKHGEIISAMADGVVSVWDVDGLFLKAAYPRKDSQPIKSATACGNVVASLSSSGSLDVWDLEFSRLGTRSDPNVMTDLLGFSPNGQLIVVVRKDDGWKTSRCAQLWDAASLRSPKLLRAPSPIEYRCVVFSPDSESLACASEDGSITIWSTRSGDSTHTWNINDKLSHVHVQCLAFSPDGRTLAVFCALKRHNRFASLRLWNLTSTPLTSVLVSDDIRIGWPGGASLEFSRDGEYLVYANYDLNQSPLAYHIPSRTTNAVFGSIAWPEDCTMRRMFFTEKSQLSLWAMDTKADRCDHYNGYLFDVSTGNLVEANSFPLKVPRESCNLRIRNPQNKLISGKGIFDLEKVEIRSEVGFSDMGGAAHWWTWKGRPFLATRIDEQRCVAFYDNMFAWATESGDIRIIELDQATVDKFERWFYKKDDLT